MNTKTPLEQRREQIKMIVARIVNHDEVAAGELDAALNELQRAAIDSYIDNHCDMDPYVY